MFPWLLITIFVLFSVITIAVIADLIRRKLNETRYKDIPFNELRAKILSKDTKRVRVGLKKKEFSLIEVFRSMPKIDIEHNNADVQVEVGEEFDLEV